MRLFQAPWTSAGNCQVIAEPEKLAHSYFVKDVYLEPGQIVSTSVFSPLEGVLELSRINEEIEFISGKVREGRTSILLKNRTERNLCFKKGDILGTVREIEEVGNAALRHACCKNNIGSESILRETVYNVKRNCEILVFRQLPLRTRY